MVFIFFCKNDIYYLRVKNVCKIRLNIISIHLFNFSELSFYLKIVQELFTEKQILIIYIFAGLRFSSG